MGFSPDGEVPSLSLSVWNPLSQTYIPYFHIEMCQNKNKMRPSPREVPHPKTGSIGKWVVKKTFWELARLVSICGQLSGELWQAVSHILRAIGGRKHKEKEWVERRKASWLSMSNFNILGGGYTHIYIFHISRGVPRVRRSKWRFWPFCKGMSHRSSHSIRIHREFNIFTDICTMCS